MTQAMFAQRLAEIKSDFQLIDKKVDELVKGLSPIVEDAAGVPATWLSEMIDHHLETLIYAVNDSLQYEPKKVEDFISYYIWEMNFGGEISWTDDKGEHKYDLKDPDNVWDYIKAGL